MSISHLMITLGLGCGMLPGVLVLTVLLGLLADGYYLLTADELTTTAHVCAACLGYAAALVITQAFPTNAELLLFQ